MDELAREYLRDFYRKGLMLHGDRPEALRWNAAFQEKRYTEIMGIAPQLEGKRVLDYGCGKADLLGHIKSQGIGVRYTGIDITPELISLARQKYPGTDLRVLDIEETPLSNEERFDYVFICGVFNNRIQGTEESMRNVMRILFGHTLIGLAITALSIHTRSKQIDLNYTDPRETLAFAKREITPHALLRESDTGEFMLFLYREPVQ